MNREAFFLAQKKNQNPKEKGGLSDQVGDSRNFQVSALYLFNCPALTGYAQHLIRSLKPLLMKLLPGLFHTTMILNIEKATGNTQHPFIIMGKKNNWAGYASHGGAPA